MIDNDSPNPTMPEHPKVDIQRLSQLDSKEIANEPRFQAWAGENWQSDGELLTGPDGAPMMFYHGGLPNISEFSTEQTPNTSPDQTGMYFTPRIDEARFYADKLKIDQSERGLPQESSIYAVMLKMKNPYMREKGDEVMSTTIKVAPEGYDGVVNPQLREVVVFNPDQIFIAAETPR